jgi:SAM-dependent methyltransferase
VKSSNRYATYEQYLADQPTKARLPEWQERMAADRTARVEWFRSRFAKLPLTPGTVLCLGARYGEEVEAFRQLGFVGAIGIDLEPCLPWVQAGDMNRLDFPDESVSIVYSNAFDHCWQPTAFIAEIERVLKPGGLAVLHLTFSLGRYETHVPTDATDVSRLFACSEMNYDESMQEWYGIKHELVARKWTSPCT